MSAGRLTLVAGPIGNLGDLSPRARQALMDHDIPPDWQPLLAEFDSRLATARAMCGEARLAKLAAADAESKAAARQALEFLVLMMAPMMPHLAEECWEALGGA